ncbi:hypothetical protein H6P81_018376 [Aristolochia fimbriata]|uniref:Integrase catalytic domain-containing protein n=1 Tax=Aristolochia fimbriata TaxID=158543 RepID=A0AAV7E175_ARIFI|nr:hypothetical protein H6P81_018376 [Aristolochia fimbriata]
MVNHMSVADSNQEDDEFVSKETPATLEKGPAPVFVHSHTKLLEQRGGVSSHSSRTRHGGRDEAAVAKNLRRLGIVKKFKLVPFWRHVGELLAQIPKASLHYVPQSENGPPDALAGIVASLAQFNERPSQVPICERRVVSPPAEEETEAEQIEEMKESFPISASQNEVRDWREPISNFLFHDTLPVNLGERVHVRRAALRYVFINDVLSRRSYEGLLLCCLSKEEGLQVLKETQGGICGAHQAGPKLHLQPPEPLHPTIASWPFKAWGMDIIGPITPKSNSDRQYILVATDYFSKWAEATVYREVKATTVADFIQTQIIYQYGVPRYIVMDNGTLFRNKVMDRFCEKFRIQQRTSSAYNPTSNGLAEAFNKMLCKILKKTIGANKKSWDEKLGEALWAYRMSFRTPTQSTPYSLVYGTEAVLPLEVQLPSLRIAIREGLTTEECAQQQLAELESPDEQRLEAQQRLECYQSRMTQAFNKKVRLRSFQKGDLVHAVRRPMLFMSKIGGKFAPKWEGLYVVQ